MNTLIDRMNTARRYYAELIAGDEVHSDDILIDWIVVGNYAVRVDNEDSLINTYRIAGLVLRNADNVRSDIGVIKDRVFGIDDSKLI